MGPSRQGVDLNCATQLWPLPFDGSNAPLKKKKKKKKDPIKRGRESVVMRTSPAQSHPFLSFSPLLRFRVLSLFSREMAKREGLVSFPFWVEK